MTRTTPRRCRPGCISCWRTRLYVNDSATPLGSNRDRHINLGDGAIGREGMAAFLSEPRFEGLPCVLEGPGRESKGLVPEDLADANRIREEGLKARG